MEFLLATTFSKSNVDKTIDGYIPVLEETLDKYPDVGLLRMQPNQVLSYVRGFYGEIRSNYDEYLNALSYPTPVFTATPVTNQDGTITFAWESSRDFEGDLINYSIRLAKDPSMQQVIFEEDNLIVTSFTYSGSLEGTYYFEVNSIDSDGNKQITLDTYQDPFTGLFYYGIRQLKFE